MRIILLVLLFLVWETWSPSLAHWQWLPISLGLPIFFGGYCLLILITRIWGRRLARGLLVGDLSRAVDRFNWGIAVSRALIPTWFAVGVFLLGWKPAVDFLLGPVANWPVITPGTLLGLIPGFVGWMGLWWSQFPVDRALREQNLLYQLESDLPVLAPPTFGDYFVNKLRVQLLFTIVPLVLIMSLRDLAAIGIAGLSHTSIGQQWGLRLPISDWLETTLSMASVLVVLVVSPELLRHVLHTQRLPESRLRQNLSDICQRAGIGCREILLWQTQNNMGNAAVMGLIPHVRYVMLSDLLLESMTDLQIQAVFAHELGHVKHRHLAWFVVFFLAVFSSLLSIASLLENYLTLRENWREVFDFSSMFICGGVLLVGYGFLSRWFERQADVYAARALEQPVTDQESSPIGLGAAIFASALERVAIVNNIPITARNWTHGSIHSRMRYIYKLGSDPDVAARFDRTGRRVFFGLIVLICACIAITVYGQMHG